MVCAWIIGYISQKKKKKMYPAPHKPREHSSVFFLDAFYIQSRVHDQATDVLNDKADIIIILNSWIFLISLEVKHGIILTVYTADLFPSFIDIVAFYS